MLYLTVAPEICVCICQMSRVELSSGICMYLYLSRMGIKETAPGIRDSGHHLGSRGKWWWGRGAAQRVPRYLVKTSVVTIYHLRIKRLHMNCVTWDRTVSETV